MHDDPDVLALLAIDDPSVSQAERSHAQTCALCAADLRSLRRVVELARSSGAETASGEPGPGVWASIERELADGGVAVPASEEVSRRSHGRVARDPARRRRVAAAVAGALAAVAVTLAIISGVTAIGSGSGSVVAETRLDAFPSWTGSAGTATVEQLDDGSRELVIDLRTRPNSDHPVLAGHREVWLLSADATELVGLGEIDGAEASFPLPAGVTLADYPIVDVSAEPDDGDPAHSGDSIVRGTLRP